MDCFVGYGIIREPFLFNGEKFEPDGKPEFVEYNSDKDTLQQVFDSLKKKNETKDTDIVDYLYIHNKGRIWIYKMFDCKTREIIDRFKKLREEFRRN